MELTTEIRELSPDELRKRQQISQAARILRGSVGARFDASPASSEDGLSIPKGNGRGKVRLLSRRAIDGRRREAKVFDAIATGIAKELGGSERLSTSVRSAETRSGISLMK